MYHLSAGNIALCKEHMSLALCKAGFVLFKHNECSGERTVRPDKFRTFCASSTLNYHDHIKLSASLCSSNIRILHILLWQALCIVKVKNNSPKPTVGQLSLNHFSVCFSSSVSCMSVTCWLQVLVGHLLVNSWPTVGQQQLEGSCCSLLPYTSLINI